MDSGVLVAYRPVKASDRVRASTIQPRWYIPRGGKRIVNPLPLMAPLVRLQLGAHLDNRIGINVL